MENKAAAPVFFKWYVDDKQHQPRYINLNLVSSAIIASKDVCYLRLVDTRESLVLSGEKCITRLCAALDLLSCSAPAVN